MTHARLTLTRIGRLWAFDLVTPFRHIWLGGFWSEWEARAVAERLCLRLGRTMQ